MPSNVPLLLPFTPGPSRPRPGLCAALQVGSSLKHKHAYARLIAMSPPLWDASKIASSRVVRLGQS